RSQSAGHGAARGRPEIREPRPRGVARACARSHHLPFVPAKAHSAVIVRESGRSSNRNFLETPLLAPIACPQITGCPAFAGHDGACAQPTPLPLRAPKGLNL